jgi:(5-formylfuran-3-yl)methyl phosphate synthase
MHLLVSVRSAEEAAAALAGGADVIDAKDPAAGALGAVPARVFREIRTLVGDARPVSAALGDATDAIATERAARASAEAGARFVKIGFAGTRNATTIAEIVAGAVYGSRSASVEQTGVVAVAYADAAKASSLAFEEILAVASLGGAEGVLVDTADKRGPGLRQLVTSSTLSRWVADAHDAGLFVAVSGKLTADDLGFVRDSGADIAGVRGAACEGGRTGRLSADKVRLLAAADSRR